MATIVPRRFLACVLALCASCGAAPADSSPARSGEIRSTETAIVWSGSPLEAKAPLRVSDAGRYFLTLRGETLRDGKLEVQIAETKSWPSFSAGRQQVEIGQATLPAGATTIRMKSLDANATPVFGSPSTLQITALFLPPNARSPHSPATLAPMVPLFHRWHLEKGPEKVRQAAATGAKRLNFCILLLSELDAKHRVQNYGMVWPAPEKADGTEFRFQPMTAEMRDQWKRWLAAAFGEAVRQKMEIAILPHLDATGKVQEWRNFFNFDPTRKISGWSYEDAMLGTIREALADAVPPDWPVEMCLEGEMGRTLFSYPAEWTSALTRLRQKAGRRNFSAGLSANYENVRGGVMPNTAQRKSMAALLQAADFVGISCYCRVSQPPVTEDFAACVEHFAHEFAEAGCPLPPDKPLRYSEIGLGGGGMTPQGQTKVPADSIADLSRAAFFGTADVGKNPWTNPGFREYRRGYYDAALSFLESQPARWPVRSAFLWSFGSWDVHGFEAVELGDPMITERISKHNAAHFRSAKE